ncbi:hypothetical protein [Paenibacillus marinisediminis]
MQREAHWGILPVTQAEGMLSAHAAEVARTGQSGYNAATFIMSGTNPERIAEV